MPGPPIRKRFGQNFLTDQGALARIVAALELDGSETVLEVGPGRGALTDHLVDRCRRLVCIEIDRDLVALLRERYAARPTVEIVSADVLDVPLGPLAGGPYVLVGNVPYYVTTPIIFHSLEAPRPERGVFLVQREVAERLVAAPGTRAYGALTVNVALAARVEWVGTVGAGAFFPRPEVESAIVRFRYLTAADPAAAARQQFVVGLFGQRRRQLVRALRTVTGCDALRAGAAVAAIGVSPDTRAETLAPAQFDALYQGLRDA